ncbi:hypothetical protein N2152v2_003939 [Parachlorella kessleri]
MAALPLSIGVSAGSYRQTCIRGMISGRRTNTGGLPKGPAALTASKHTCQSMRTQPPRASSEVAESTSSAVATADGAKYSVEPGLAQPLGASPAAEGGPGVNFALASHNATAVTLCLFDQDDKPLLEAPMHKTGDVWHAVVRGLPQSGVLYGFKVAGKGGWDTPHRWDDSKVLLDPYAKAVKGRVVFGERDSFEQFKRKTGSVFRGTFDFEAPEFDWGPDYSRPNLPLKDLVIYEASSRTDGDSSSGLAPGRRGTFLGLADKIPHLLELGVNAVELLPVFEYDELEFQRVPNPREHMVNVWGYSHLNFFAPMSRFAAEGGGPLAAQEEFKELVRRLHGAGIEVILDVVYNHTVEGGDDDPYLLSWRGIDCSTYYQQDPGAYVQMLNYSGCGNTVNANHPTTLRQVMDSLRHVGRPVATGRSLALLWWVEEYHVDGFRFDLASCLCRDAKGHPLADPPLIRAISKDPVLSKVKLIAEPWDIGMYQVGSFPNWDVWAEWNGKFRDDVRRFIRWVEQQQHDEGQEIQSVGDQGMKSGFATRLAGSADLYHKNNRKPYHSINFVIAHDGFTLHDLVAYNDKHNQANGEGNRDGTNDNFSWNCGVEGPTDNAAVLALRARQMRNLHLALMLAQGTPMILAGDEYAASKQGNNNWYGHDTQWNHFHWDEMEKAQENGWFYAGLIKLRRDCPLLGRSEFLTPQDITWHEDRWDDPESRFLAFTLHDRGQGCGDLYAAFNAHSFEVTAHLPPPPKGKHEPPPSLAKLIVKLVCCYAGRKWCRVVDTNLPSPRDFTPGGNSGVDANYRMQPYAAILLVANLAA